MGHLAVNPLTMTIDVAPSLMGFPAYALLKGKSLAVSATLSHQRWLADHWAEHRQGANQ
jgi:hypothetical protein